jgi:hypothetical protein
MFGITAAAAPAPPKPVERVEGPWETTFELSETVFTVGLCVALNEVHWSALYV